MLEVPETELEEIVIPALLLQPLVENAIKHGLQPARSSENYLLLHIYEQDNVLFIEVQDNGVGLLGSRNRSLNLAHESFALNNIQQRIDYFNSLYSRKITFLLQEITEGEVVKGTRATIKITLI
jgi:sensor histidine kinase YesM